MNISYLSCWFLIICSSQEKTYWHVDPQSLKSHLWALLPSVNSSGWRQYPMWPEVLIPLEGSAPNYLRSSEQLIKSDRIISVVTWGIFIQTGLRFWLLVKYLDPCNSGRWGSGTCSLWLSAKLLKIKFPASCCWKKTSRLCAEDEEKKEEIMKSFCCDTEIVSSAVKWKKIQSNSVSFWFE